jgi:RNA polymerase sigma-70 factor (ECF subfamily)
MDDTEIIDLYLRRSERAIEASADKYGQYLHRTIFNILKDGDDSEEILNDTYMGAWNAIPPTIPQSLKYFLSRIARNLSLDRLDHKMAGKRKAVFAELDESVPDMGKSTEEVWETEELGRILNAFLGTLDRRTCAVFVARYYYTVSLKDLAKQYAFSERQIKYMLEKTRKKLRKYLEKEGVAV